MTNLRRNLLPHLNELGWMPQPYASDYATETVTAVGDVVAPSTPENLIASVGPEKIIIEWDEVTTDFDGSDCNDLDQYLVYWVRDTNYTGSIDPDDDSTYDSVEKRKTLTWSQEVPAGQKRHYVVTATDDTGNESEASNETFATADPLSLSTDVSDYTSNISEVLVGDQIIGIVFEQPNPSWSGYSHYALYYDVDDGGGYTSSWTKIYEGPNPAYAHKGLNDAYAYKYKLTFVDVDGGETSGTVSDNSGSGYTPNNSDNSNITGNTFLAQNLVAVNEVRGNAIYAESSIVLGGIDDSGYIKSDNYSGTTIGSDTTDGFLIKADGSAEFNDVTVRGNIDAANMTLTGDLSDLDSNMGTLTAGKIQLESGKIEIGDDVLGAGLHGILINDGSDDRVRIGELSSGVYGLEAIDANGKTIFNSNGEFVPAPAVDTGATAKFYDGQPGTSVHTIDLSSQVTAIESRRYLVLIKCQYDAASYKARLIFRDGDVTSLPSPALAAESRGTNFIQIGTSYDGYVWVPTNAASEISFKSADNNDISLWVEYAIPVSY